MTRVSRWCTLAGVTAGLLGLTVPASAATGSGWTVVTPPASTAGAQLTGSYAVSDTDAWAVGGPASAGAAPVALNWNGTAWSSVPTPTPSGSTPNWAFASVAASSASDAWAVGEQRSSCYRRCSLPSLYEHWNGTAWSVVAGPNEGPLNAVLDFSPTNAWAFADFVVLHWNGTAWSVVSGALPALAVSADGPNDIWGIYRNDQVTHYNGTSWSVYTLGGPIGTVFESVHALSPTDVWVGGGIDGGGPVLEHFNGTSWKVMSTPSSFSGAGVFAIAARSDSDVWIFSVHDPLAAAVLLAHWNGSSWTTSPSPIPADTSVSIGSAASSPSHVWLFGYDGATGGPMILSHS
ncbi:MAG TPA: hypothetical protein VIX86_21615 [Streptosporangiaceae bacterium]